MEKRERGWKRREGGEEEERVSAKGGGQKRRREAGKGQRMQKREWVLKREQRE